MFANSREETEYLCATFRQIARERSEPDVFLIHHGNRTRKFSSVNFIYCFSVK